MHAWYITVNWIFISWKIYTSCKYHKCLLFIVYELFSIEELIFEGEFIKGKVYGGGLLTFADGSNGTKLIFEGIFKETQF